jgi:hypothetical protein
VTVEKIRSVTGDLVRQQDKAKASVKAEVGVSRGRCKRAQQASQCAAQRRMPRSPAGEWSRDQRQGTVPRWVEQGMSERYSRAEQLEHRIQTILGIFSANGVLPPEFKPAHSAGDLLSQHLDELEPEAERKGGVMPALSDHFAKVYRLAPVAA